MLWCSHEISLLTPAIPTGLYHKLHGVHRPEAMKKTIIKRRKRVVAPANGNFPSRPASAVVTVPQQAQQQGAFTDGSQIDTEMGGMSITSPTPTHRGHLAVDFTTPRPPASTLAAPVAPMQQIEGSNAAGTYENPQSRQRKRSLSQAMDADSPDGRGHQSISSILNNAHGGAGGDVPIEPSLLALGIVNNAELTPQQKRQQLLERKAAIENETRRLQEALELCNTEIEKLEEGKDTITESNSEMVARAVAAAAVVGN